MKRVALVSSVLALVMLSWPSIVSAGVPRIILLEHFGDCI